MRLSSPSHLIVRSTFPYLFPRISWSSVSRIYIHFSLFSRTSTARSTLSALRLSKLSRRDETRLSCGAQILPFSSPLFFCLEQPAARWFWTKAVKRMHRWQSHADSFIISLLLFVRPLCSFLSL